MSIACREICVAVAVLAVVSVTVSAATLQVPAQYPTIQAAIDAAVDGDVILVDAGVYAEQITFRGKAIRVSGMVGAVINGGDTAPCVTFDSGETREAILEGFDLVRGAGTFLVTSTYGGGIYCNGSSPTLRDNRIASCWADLGAGLASIGGGSPLVTGNSFDANGVADSGMVARMGGAIYVEGPGGAVIDGNSCAGNTAARYGSAITIADGADVLLVGNEVHDNRVVGSLSMGGAVAVLRSEPTVDGNRIHDNHSDFAGGGLLLEEALGLYRDNDIDDNTAVFFGGGVRITGVGFAPLLRNNRVRRNEAGVGGGIACENAEGPILTRMLIADNKTVGRIEGGGGGLVMIDSPHVLLTETTITGNSTGYGGGGVAADGSKVTVRLCRIEGNSAEQFGGGLYSTGSTLDVRRCALLDNQARGGGGVGLVQSDCVLTNCVVAGNQAGVSGGGMLFDRTSAVITSVTCTGNSAGLTGGGMQISGTSETRTITNTIFWNDSAPQSTEIADGSPGTFLTFCDVQGGWSGAGNVDADPLFVDAAAHNFRLRLESPLIDIGDPAAPEQDSIDFEGDPRELDGDGDSVADIDIGADEVAPWVAARFGTVDASSGALADVLLVNGSAGDSRREVFLAAGQSIRVEMTSPPAGPPSAGFALYAFLEVPDSSTVTPQPFGLGTATFVTPLNRALPQQAAKIWNNLGFEHRLGVPDFPSTAAPSTVLDLPGGIQQSVRVTFQGFIEDQGSAAAGPASLTNAVVLFIGP